MFKTIVVLSTLFASLNIFAKQTEVPAEQVKNYIQAVQIALENKPLTCNFTIGNHVWTSADLSNALTSSTAATVNNGEQPVLVLKGPSATSNFSFSVATTEDLKSVTMIDFQQSNCVRSNRKVNLGTITSPKIEIVEETNCTTIFAAICQ